uniref:Uncharacterized protein n=1 Tax=Aegilops tauschii subsp. strangulata TaxID=200361 RepID=A0A453DJG4_AEGTS
SAVAGGGRLQCRHLWAPAGLLSLAHLAFYAAVAHHLRCLNGFRSFLLSFFCYNRFGFDLVE